MPVPEPQRRQLQSLRSTHPWAAEHIHILEEQRDLLLQAIRSQAAREAALMEALAKAAGPAPWWLRAWRWRP